MAVGSAASSHGATAGGAAASAASATSNANAAHCATAAAAAAASVRARPQRGAAAANYATAAATAAAVRARLNPAQQRAVLAPLDRPLLVLAGAGSGKTSVMVRRVCHMLARGVGAPRILCVTFTRAAAEEMQTRLVKAIGPRAKEATVSTFHALSLQICRAHAERAGYPKDFAVWQGRQQRRLLARTLDELRVRVAAGAADVAELPPPAKWAEPERLLQRLARAKAKGDAPEDVADPLLSACYARYVEQMRAAGALDFLDLIRVAFELLESHADVRASLRARHTHVLVDEFQDTNALQLRLLRLLAPHTAADGGENRAAVTVVGDDDQAIYSFQGAAGSFKGFEAAYPGAASVTLDQNYRSSGTIVGAAAAVVAHNAARTPKAPFTHNGGGERVQIVECRTAACEARQAATNLGRGRRQAAISSLPSSRAWPATGILVAETSDDGADEKFCHGAAGQGWWYSDLTAQGHE